MEMRSGPATSDAKVELAAGQLLFRALVKGDVTFRDDGRGWYETDSPPGVGLDPRTAALLPTLLRHGTQPAEIDPATVASRLGVAGTASRALVATTSVAVMPGVIAADCQPFTVLSGPMTFTFDDAGGLRAVIVTARNTNLKDYDLVVVTELGFGYDNVPKALPDSTPLAPRDVTPVSQP
jgi:hypothetical protein